MPQAATLRVEGYRELMLGLVQADRGTRKAVRDELRQAGEHVRSEAAIRFAPVDARSAANYRVVVRRRGVNVEQRLRRTTGKHPEYGRLQMRRALLPALYANEDETIRELEQALDRICARFNAGGVL